MTSDLTKAAFHLSLWLRNQRMTKKDFAKDMGVSYHVLSRFINCRKLPPLEFAIRVETATGGYVKAHDWILPVEDKEEAAA